MIHDHDLEYAAPVSDAEHHRILDAGQAALLRKRSALIDELRAELAAVALDRDYWRREAEINAGALDHAIAEIRRLNTPIAGQRNTVVTPNPNRERGTP